MKVWTITPTDCMGLTAPIKMVELAELDKIQNRLDLTLELLNKQVAVNKVIQKEFVRAGLAWIDFKYREQFLADVSKVMGDANGSDG